MKKSETFSYKNTTFNCPTILFESTTPIKQFESGSFKITESSWGGE